MNFNEFPFQWHFTSLENVFFFFFCLAGLKNGNFAQTERRRKIRKAINQKKATLVRLFDPFYSKCCSFWMNLSLWTCVFNPQIQTGMVQMSTARTRCVTQCLLLDPLEWERLLQFMLVPKSLASRCQCVSLERWLWKPSPTVCLTLVCVFWNAHLQVFEVNASSQRSGRLILSQLKEATQSHQVDSQGRGAPKHSYFTSYGTSSASGTLRPGSSPSMHTNNCLWWLTDLIPRLHNDHLLCRLSGKGNSPRRVVSSPRKNPQSPRGAKKGGLAPVSLANFFKVGKSTNKESSNSTKDEQKGKNSFNAWSLQIA